MNFPNDFSLKDKIAVVTGGAGLIGKAICKALAEAGAKVYIADINSDKSQVICGEIRQDSLNAEWIDMDITSEESIKGSVSKIIKNEGKIDIWINNAYPRTSDWGDKFETIKASSLKKNVDMHMNGYFVCCQKALEEMKKRQEGVLLNIGSHYGVLGPNFSIYEDTDMTMPAAYSLIKGGIVNFSRYLATYYARYNLRVNAVCPGGVFDNQDQRFVDRYCKLVPLQRMASPDDIAGPVLFLCSDAASYMTGQVIMVDGGLSAW